MPETIQYPCTIGDVVRLTGEELHRVEYAIARAASSPSAGSATSTSTTPPA